MGNYTIENDHCIHNGIHTQEHTRTYLCIRRCTYRGVRTHTHSQIYARIRTMARAHVVVSKLPTNVFKYTNVYISTHRYKKEIYVSCSIINATIAIVLHVLIYLVHVLRGTLIFSDQPEVHDVIFVISSVEEDGGRIE